MLVTRAEVSNLDIPLNFSRRRDAEDVTCGEKELARWDRGSGRGRGRKQAVEKPINQWRDHTVRVSPYGGTARVE